MHTPIHSPFLSSLLSPQGLISVDSIPELPSISAMSSLASGRHWQETKGQWRDQEGLRFPAASPPPVSLFPSHPRSLNGSNFTPKRVTTGSQGVKTSPMAMVGDPPKSHSTNTETPWLCWEGAY